MVGAIAVAALIRLAPAVLLTAPQRDFRLDPLTPRSVDVSAGGRYVAFESQARLVPADTNNSRGIYVLDLETQQVTLESSGHDPAIDDAAPRLSADGRFLVFESTSAMAEGDERPFTADIVLRDRSTAISRVITIAPNGAPANGPSRSPDISDDGRLIVFASSATNLVNGADANGREEDIYAFDTATATMQRVSIDEAGVQPSTGASNSPSVSGDGRWVAFASTAALEPPSASATSTRGRRPAKQVFVRDLHGRGITRASLGNRAEAPDGNSWGPAINSDGRFVAFVSEATNLGGGGRNRTADIFLRDVMAGTTMRVSRGVEGEDASGTSVSPAISADGRTVVFQSDASNLECAKRCLPGREDINLLWDVFVFDRVTAAIARVSDDDSGEWMEASRGPAVDGLGRVLAFASRHPIDALDRGDDFDLFVRLGPAAPTTVR